MSSFCRHAALPYSFIFFFRTAFEPCGSLLLEHVLDVSTVAFAGVVLHSSQAYWALVSVLLAVAFHKVVPAADAETIAHWGLPLAFTAGPSHRILDGGVLLTESPQILLQVSSIDALGRHRVEGYGFARIPACAGSVDLEVSTWRPLGTRNSLLVDHFIGGAHRLKDLRFAAQPPRTETDTVHKRRFLSRLGFATRSSGRVRIRAQVIEQFSPPGTSVRPPSVRQIKKGSCPWRAQLRTLVLTFPIVYAAAPRIRLRSSSMPSEVGAWTISSRGNLYSIGTH